MKKLQKIWLLACVLGAMGNGFVSAEETPVYMLDTVNVTAQAYEKKELDTPADVTVVTGQELQASGRENVAQALKYEPGIMVSAMGPHDQSWITGNTSVNL